ncbi:MAG: DUF433 domain-containing protein [Phaeodactylibacter sp.]|nr:DUF433 domain-containing protein [Phaeodactylibacter sp.]
MIDYRKHIQSNPKVMLGKPTVKGTRITVELLLRKIADGYTFEEVLDMYPHLKLEDILASIAYAAAIIESEEI